MIKKVFKETLENLGNPFLEQEPQLVHILSKKLLDQKAIESVKCEGASSLYDTIKKTSLALYCQNIV